MTARRMCIAWLVAIAALPTWAADAFTDAMQTAYVPYRTALFRTNGKDVQQAVEATEQTLRAWQALASRFAAQPPAPYTRDAQFAATLAQVAAVYERADQQVKAGRLAEAHETLEQVRDQLAELRRRNNVVVYSDHMNAYHAVMEYTLDEGAKAEAATLDAMRLMARVGALEYLAARLRAEAPDALRQDADFNAQLQALDASVAALRGAVLGGDPQKVREALARLKPAYSRMFLKYG